MCVSQHLFILDDLNALPSQLLLVPLARETPLAQENTKQNEAQVKDRDNQVCGGDRGGCAALSEITDTGTRERLLNLVWEGEVRFSIWPRCTLQKDTSLNTY